MVESLPVPAGDAVGVDDGGDPPNGAGAGRTLALSGGHVSFFLSKVHKMPSFYSKKIVLLPLKFSTGSRVNRRLEV